MDPVTVLLIGVVGYFLLSQSASGQSALASALQKITGSSGSSKPSAGAAPAGSSAAALAAKAAAALGTSTPQATIDALASDGNASDGQVAAYLQALNEGNTQLADAIIGDDASINLESDPDPYTPTYAPVDTPPAYVPPTVTYDPGTDDSGDSGDSGDYGDDGEDD